MILITFDKLWSSENHKFYENLGRCMKHRPSQSVIGQRAINKIIVIKFAEKMNNCVGEASCYSPPKKGSGSDLTKQTQLP